MFDTGDQRRKLEEVEDTFGLMLFRQPLSKPATTTSLSSTSTTISIHSRATSGDMRIKTRNMTESLRMWWLALNTRQRDSLHYGVSFGVFSFGSTAPSTGTEYKVSIIYFGLQRGMLTGPTAIFLSAKRPDGGIRRPAFSFYSGRSLGLGIDSTLPREKCLYMPNLPGNPHICKLCWIEVDSVQDRCPLWRRHRQ